MLLQHVVAFTVGLHVLLSVQVIPKRPIALPASHHRESRHNRESHNFINFVSGGVGGGDVANDVSVPDTSGVEWEFS